MNKSQLVSKHIQSIEVPNADGEHLLGLNSYVAFDGQRAFFDVHFTNNRPFRLVVDNADMASIFTQIRHASTLMLSRQRLHLDRGASAMLELMQHAIQPAKTDVMIDRTNYDRLFLFQFLDHAPLAMRASATECGEVRAKLAILSGTLLN